MANASYSLKGKRVWVAGHRGMAGGAILRRLASEDCECLTATSAELDLRRQAEVEAWVAARKPQAVFVAAGRVGGIVANDTQPVDFLYDNLLIEANTIATAHRAGVEKLLFLSSSCSYPRLAPQPMSEDALLTGPLEPTNQWYAVAKIAGMKLTEAYRRQHGADFISVMPTNLYGPGDNYHPEHSHVLPGMILRFHEAKERGDGEVKIWGTGTPRREFLFADDLADACLFAMRHYDDTQTPLNLGGGTDLSIRETAEAIRDVVGYEGELTFDTTKPDGMPLKSLDSTPLLGLGWKPTISFTDALQKTYEAFLKHREAEARNALELTHAA
jgi:GDP-L-fucose synthase